MGPSTTAANKKHHHVFITDVDNVFLSYLNMSILEQSDYDVHHAYGIAYPYNVHQEMGFTVCGGFAWLRSTRSVSRFVKSMLNMCNCVLKHRNANTTKTKTTTPTTLLHNLTHDAFCNSSAYNNNKNNNKKKKNNTELCYCDDEVVLNELLWKGPHKVTWDRSITPLPPKSKELPDLQWKPITGISNTTRHSVWDRNFAFRGLLPPNRS